MKRLQSILFATDFRPASEQAAQAAVHLAWVFGSRVTLVHVLQPVPTWPVLMHQQREQAGVQLRELAANLAAQKVVITESSIVVGQPADAIVHRADEIEADLILIGAGERSRFDHFFAGPIANAVLQHASQPVLAVRPGEPPVKFRRILCPVDQSSVSARGLANAIRLARAFDGHLVVLSVVPSIGWISMAVETGKLTEAAEEHGRRWREDFWQFLNTCDFGDGSWEKELRTGAPHEEIVAAAQAHQADLIVMGSTGRTGLARILMGSVTRRVLQQLPCSLLTVKQEGVLDEMHEEEVRTIHMLVAEGQALLAARSYEAALVKFGQVLARNPFHVPALEGRAKACEKLGRAEKAERCRRRAQAVEHASHANYDKL